MRGNWAAIAVAVLLVSIAPVTGASSTEGSVDAPNGATVVAVDAAAADRAFVFLSVTPHAQPFAFGLDADAVTLIHEHTEFRKVGNPAPSTLYMLGDNLYELGANRHRDESTHVAATAFSSEVRPGASLLVQPLDGATHAALLRAGAVGTLASSADAAVVRSPGYAETGEVEAGDQGRYWLLKDVPGPHVNFTAPARSAEVRGDFAVHLWNVAFDIRSDAGTVSVQTGRMEESRAGSVSQEFVANATLIVRDGVLRVTGGSDPVSTFAGAIELTGVQGIRMPRADGALQVANGGRYVAEGGSMEADGAMNLTARPSDGDPDHLSVAMAGTMTGTNLAFEGPVSARAGGFVVMTPAWWGGAAAALLVAVGATVTLHRRGALPALPRRRPGAMAPHVAAEEAVDAIEAKEYGRAVAALDVALGADPDNADLHIDRGFCLQELGDTQGARLAYERAVLADPGRAEAHYYYARSLCALGLTATAISHLTRAFALDRRLTEQAAGDAAFRSLRDHPRFVGLLAPVDE